METYNSRRHRVRIATMAIAFLGLLIQPCAQAANEAAGTLDRVRQTGKLTLGYNADARPFSYRDESGNAAGFAVALCQKIAEQVKAELTGKDITVEWVPVSGLSEVQQGKVDLLCAPQSVTLTKRKEVAFSIPIFPGGVGALVRADSSRRLRAVLLEGPAARQPIWRASPAKFLEQQTFSVIAGTTAQKWLAGRMDEFQISANVVTVDDYDAGIKQLLNRNANVFFGDRTALTEFAKRSPAARHLLVLDRTFSPEPIALALKRGDEDFRLVVDRALSRVFSSAGIGALYEQWLGKPEKDALAFFRQSALPE
jgi:ABC-type amino acid transport substrate-binding protein